MLERCHQSSYLLLLAFLLVVLHKTQAIPFPLNSVTKQLPMPTGDQHPMLEIWRRAIEISTAITSDQHSPASGVLSAMRSGPLAAVYRATLSTASSLPCTATSSTKCEVAADSFASVGEVHYNFKNFDNNLQGNSKQVLVACRCLNHDCSQALLMRPVTVAPNEEDGNMRSSRNTVCLYEAVGDIFSDCHTELFRISHRERDYGLNIRTDDDFEYSVSDEHHGDFWTARGRRGSKRDCLAAEIEQLPTVNLSKLTISDIGFNNHSTDPASPPCFPPKGVQYFRTEDESEDNTCTDIIDRALSSATHIASQQDCFGVGKRPIAFMDPRSATLISDTELALTCSSAVLGIMLLWSVFWQQLRKEDNNKPYIRTAVLLQVALSYVLEALPMHTALSNEIRARDWRTILAFADATRSYNVLETITESVLIVTIVLGEAQYLTTRVCLVAGLTALFDFVAVTLGLLILIQMLGHLRPQKKVTNDVENSLEPSIVDSSSVDGSKITKVRSQKFSKKSRPHRRRFRCSFATPAYLRKSTNINRTNISSTVAYTV